MFVLSIRNHYDGRPENEIPIHWEYCWLVPVICCEQILDECRVQKFDGSLAVFVVEKNGGA